MAIRSSVRRHPRAWTAAALGAVSLLVFLLVWFEPQKLFLDQKVDEALPTAAAPASASPAVTEAAVPAPSPPAPEAGGASAPPAGPGSQLEVLARGEFRSLEHHSTGSARLLRLANGDLYLRFEDLDTSNGPDLVVYLTAREASDDWHGWDRGEHLDLGSLKGNVGDQNYLLPAGSDLSRYASAVIWCRRFKVGFAVAPLVAG
jgi:hypothetical protein